VRVRAAELVHERGLVAHRPDEDQAAVAFECGSGVRDDVRLGLQHENADRADGIHHRAIPNDCTRYVMSTLRVITSWVSARERTARSIVAWLSRRYLSTSAVWCSTMMVSDVDICGCCCVVSYTRSNSRLLI